MNEDHVNYLQSIGITTEALQDKINKIIDSYNAILDDFKIDEFDIVVSEYIDEEGKRKYENLWLISNKYVLEAKQFIKEDDLDVVLRDKIRYLRIKKQSYDFGDSNENSRLNIIFTYKNGIVGELKASRENCEQLNKIMMKYFRSFE